MTRCPRAYDPDQGQAARDLFPGLAPELSDLITGAAGCSPYLRALCEAEQSWLPEALTDADDALEAVLAPMPVETPDDTGRTLRQRKRRIALLLGLADLGGVWSLEEITGHLTRFADLAVETAIRSALAIEIRRGKLPGMQEDDLNTGAGMVVLGMGKMGAYELNYSSDIDLICLFDETRFDQDDFHAARTAFVRATRKMAHILSDRTAEGYVFRTDLRLRPDPSVTPVCMAMARAEAYYESLGRTWERAAYIKARVCAGDQTAGQRFLAELSPFVWRKHLDFAAIEDAHNMRLRIRAHKGLGGRFALEGHDMKLGRGGIREIEFFTQTQQLISGGRDPDLRVRGTVAGLGKLAEKEWIPVDVAQQLIDHYRSHREVEHRVQMLRDAQTHKLPSTSEEFDRLAAFMDLDRAALETDLRDRLTAVHDLIEGFFVHDDPAPEEATEQDSPLDAAIIARWPSYAALRSGRAVEIFNRLKPEILSRLSRAVEPNEALRAFDGFLSGLPAGVQLFSLFEARPQLIDLLVDIAGTSASLAQYLSRNASVFDAVIAGHFFTAWPGRAALTAELARSLAGEADYERKLDAARRWRKDWHFRVGVHHLRGLINADEAGEQYADLAAAVLRALWPEVIAQFALKHGDPPGRGAAVLGMGSLGAAKLNAGSDLDLIVIYDAGVDETSDGDRPLNARSYYARLTQALITALTAPMAEGRLYEVDMRLRPSGNQGPVATSWSAFQTYQRDEAWVWEHLALTRACVVAGPEDLSADIESFRQSLLVEKSDRAQILGGVSDMRARIAAAKSPEGYWDTKLGAGRMQDIELVAQAGLLLAPTAANRGVEAGLTAAVRSGWFAQADADTLRRAYALCWTIVQTARLLGDKAMDAQTLGEGARALLLRETGQPSLDALRKSLDELTGAAADAIASALQGYEDNSDGA